MRFVRALRTTFGLDRHFEEYERTFGSAEQTEIEALADADSQAAGMTVAAYAEQMVTRRDALLALRDDEHGVELATVHGAKGRERPTVIVFGFDEQQMPHARSLEVTPAQAAAGEGEQAERRVAYVALTRAQRHLLILHTRHKISPSGWRAAREAIRTAPSRAAGLRTAARAVCDSSSPLSGVELIDVLVDAPAMSLARAHEILQPSGLKATVRVGRLSDPRRREVAAARRGVAGPHPLRLKCHSRRHW